MLKFDLKNITSIYAVCSLVLAIGVSYAYYLSVVMPDKIILPQEEKIDDTYVWHLDNIRDKRGYVAVEGWVVKKGVSERKFNTTLALAEEGSDKAYEMKTVMVSRHDVTEHFNTLLGDQHDYSRSGFYAVVKKTEEMKGNPLRIALIDRVGTERNVNFTETYITP